MWRSATLMPPFIVRMERRGTGWIAVVYVPEEDYIVPSAVIVGPWERVRRGTVLAWLLAAPDRSHLDLSGSVTDV